MKSIFGLLAVLCSFLVCCQENANNVGVSWSNDLTWEQIKAKAKSLNKFIFLDCYTTWCAPCKLMDRDVYTKEKVGNYINSNFISVRVQMDSTKNDSEDLSRWYQDAKNIQEEFNVNVFPSYLFFFPNGKIAHRGTGAVPDTLFVKLASNALNPERQFYSLLEKYNRGIKDYNNLKYLARVAKSIGEDDIAAIVAQDYLKNFLYQNLFILSNSKDDIEFVNTFLNSSKEYGFKYFFHNSDKIDLIIKNKGYTQRKIDQIITKEEVNDRIWNGNKPAVQKPNWKKLKSTIAIKYGKAFAKRIILNSQLRWYYYHQDWPNIVKYNVEQVESYGFDTSSLGKTYFNNLVWEVVVKHSNDRAVLKKAIGWMKVVVESSPEDAQYLDTYANLLYKVGRVKEALEIERKAASLEPADVDIQNTFLKMSKGEKIW